MFSEKDMRAVEHWFAATGDGFARLMKLVPAVCVAFNKTVIQYLQQHPKVADEIRALTINRLLIENNSPGASEEEINAGVVSSEPGEEEAVDSAEDHLKGLSNIEKARASLEEEWVGMDGFTGVEIAADGQSLRLNFALSAEDFCALIWPNEHEDYPVSIFNKPPTPAENPDLAAWLLARDSLKQWLTERRLLYTTVEAVGDHELEVLVENPDRLKFILSNAWEGYQVRLRKAESTVDYLEEPATHDINPCLIRFVRDLIREELKDVVGDRIPYQTNWKGVVFLLDADTHITMPRNLFKMIEVMVQHNIQETPIRSKKPF